MNDHEFLNDIDAKLALPGQTAMRDVVRGLSDEMPSMAWRSGLNERLIAEAARRKRRARFFWALRPAAGLAMAGALAAVFVFRTSPMKAPAVRHEPTTSIEAQLLATHTQVATFADVAGTGVRPIETNYVSQYEVEDDFEWSEVDIESL